MEEHQHHDCSQQHPVNHQTDQLQHIILFYKYHPLCEIVDTMRLYQRALEQLCFALQLTGRILVACSAREGINGTLAGRYDQVRCFTYALLGPDYCEANKIWETNNYNNNAINNINKHQVTDSCQHHNQDDTMKEIVATFWQDLNKFCELGQVPPLFLNSPDDFKWSRAKPSKLSSSTELFPDLNIKLVPELIGTGGLLEAIPLEETSRGYLTPREWHEAMLSERRRKAELDDAKLSSSSSSSLLLTSDEVVLIDCRNTKEFQIGHFSGATDPETTTYSQFPKWVKDHAAELSHKKKIYMYCTGGIRCEKASAFVRRQLAAAQQQQQQQQQEESNTDDAVSLHPQEQSSPSPPQVFL